MFSNVWVISDNGQSKGQVNSWNYEGNILKIR